MSTCGYICPACNGSEIDEHGNQCHWCSKTSKEQPSQNNITDQDWLKTVHEGPCCSDIGIDKEQ